MGNTKRASKVYGSDRWNELRDSLDEKYNFSDGWNEAVAIFSRRLREYYINPIHKLKDGITGEGFVIVTAQCALIETFAAFKEGKVYDRSKEANGIYYNDSADLFVRFLKTELKFKDVFCPDIGQKVAKAKTFYSQVRCGLMHETRTKKDWIIKADAYEYEKKHKSKGKRNKSHPANIKFIAQGGGKRIIFRNQLQDVLEDWFKQYKSDLRNSDESHNNLRRLFARKLDHLYGREKDHFEWWSE